MHSGMPLENADDMNISPVALLPIGLFIGCGTAQPLSITLYNPETKVSQTCAARTSPIIRTNVEVLARAVEACARQLEAQGFVRVDQPPEP